MFARIVEFTPKPEMKNEIVNVLLQEVLPILKKQSGFMELLPFVPETAIVITLHARRSLKAYFSRTCSTVAFRTASSTRFLLITTCRERSRVKTRWVSVIQGSGSSQANRASSAPMQERIHDQSFKALFRRISA